MRLSLSTNWFRSPDMEAAEIVDRALAMGFEELELGFATPQDVGEGFKRIAGRIRIGSVHAFCPIPLSAPVASPELYPLASLDPEERALARFHLLRSAKFAAEVGADAVVLHAGRVPLATLFHRDMGTDVLRGTLIDNSKDVNAKPYAKMLDKALAVRRKRGARLLDVFKKELEGVFPRLRELGVTLALENLPYLEGFPDEEEMLALLTEFGDAPLKAWLDTGHHRVREMHGWLRPAALDALEKTQKGGHVAGMHLNDVTDLYDDHFAPGFGKVDFAALAPLAKSVPHVVFEPKSHVDEPSLRKGIALIRKVFL